MSPAFTLQFSPPVEGARYRDVSPPRASGTIGSGHRYQQAVSNNKQRLETALASALLRIENELDPGEKAAAILAIGQATTTFSAVDFGEMPGIAVTDIGTVVVQWQTSDHGAMFSFSGGAEFVVALKRDENSRYSDHVQLETVGKQLSMDTLKLIKDLSQP